MIERVFKFETEEDAESFITSITESFNATGREKSVHANTLERTGNTLIFTKQYISEPVMDSAEVTESFLEDVQSASDEGLLDGTDMTSFAGNNVVEGSGQLSVENSEGSGQLSVENSEEVL